MKDKKTPRQIAGEKLLAVYAKLAPSKRDLLEETLLQHAFLSNGGPTSNGLIGMNVIGVHHSLG
jgi:hypothetical protein